MLVLLILLAIDVAFRVVALVIVPPNRRPQTSMAWLLAIFFIPFLAFLAFLAFGSHRLSPTRRRKQATINDFLLEQQVLLPAEVTVTSDELRTRGDLPSWLPPASDITSRLAHMPMLRGNEMAFLDDYEATIAQMVADIDSATTTVHSLFYIMSVDPVTEDYYRALTDAVKRGVKVRVLFDQVATLRIPGSRAVVKRLKETGAEFHPMLPFQPWRGVYQRPDLRNHRKILTIDGTVAYTGSQNIIESGYRDPRHHRRSLRWHDLMVRATGPVVHSLEAVFITDWFQETDELLPLAPPSPDTTPHPTPTHSPTATEKTNRTSTALAKTAASGPDKTTICQVIPSGPAIDGEVNLRVFLEMLYGATRDILIISPYIVPDDSMRYAITSAALRGVRVDVVVSEIGDQPLVFHAQRSYYEELLRAGVHLHLYPAPTILHPKFVVVDSEVAVMGSSNLDMRSFTLNLELTLLLLGSHPISELTRLGRDYLDASTELSLEKWNQRSRKTRVIEGLARLTATVQ